MEPLTALLPIAPLALAYPCAWLAGFKFYDDRKTAVVCGALASSGLVAFLVMLP